MAAEAQPTTDFDIFHDKSFNASCESDQLSIDSNNSRSSALHNISVSHAQNCQSRRPGTSQVVDSLAVELKKLHIHEPHEIDLINGAPATDLKVGTQSVSRSKRLHAAHNTFDVLETVPEDENFNSSTAATVGASEDSQHYIELPAERYAHHPLSSAACCVPSVPEQLAKHRKGDFEWVLTVKIPKQPAPNDVKSAQADPNILCDTVRFYFGCNLLPARGRDGADKDIVRRPYTLLVTPLKGNAILDAATELTGKGRKMAVMEVAQQTTPSKPLVARPGIRSEELSPATTKGVFNSSVNVTTPRSPLNPVARIEDSVEALDQLEEQLEAFNVAANMRDIASRNRSTLLSTTRNRPKAPESQENRGMTPRHDKTSPTASAGVAVSTPKLRASDSSRSPGSYRPASMISMRSQPLDSPKLKVEDKPIGHAPPKKAGRKELSSLLPPKQPSKSTKPPTVPCFELPGEAVARRLKEKKEARLSMIFSTETPQAPATSVLRRTKSAKPPTRPTFELPGEAISRRKREERDARLKAQAEEERRRREFKAKPVRSGGVPSSVPRATATSMAREKKGLGSEKATHMLQDVNKRVSIVVSHEPQLAGTEQLPSRGRHITADSSQESRATSSSAGSISGKRSSVSTEDVQAQRVRGKEILRRDSMYAQDRQREKRERENLARLAREEAAERSRQQSREWAEKQKRKRMTVGSLREVVTSSS